MRAIVLVKQVPDIRAGAVRIRPDGTIDRSTASAITNPADLHAVEAALQTADEVWAVSMGPKNAESALREVLALGADRAFLLNDRLFAGSDTWATANALAAAINHIGGCDLVLCGLSALDGETGHVGPQVAQRLGVPVATWCEKLTVSDGSLIARRIVEGGYEVVSMPLPALVTVAETGYPPRYPTLRGRRRAATADVAVLTTNDLGLGEADVGLGASPTKVARLETVPLPSADCRFVDDAFTLETLAEEILSQATPRPATPVADRQPEQRATSDVVFAGHPGVWVVCETQRGDLSQVSKELLTKSVELAAQLEDGVAAVVIGSSVEQAAQEAANFGADVVMVAEDERLNVYHGPPEARIITDAAHSLKPQIMLFGATTTGRSLAPRVAAILNTGIAADCTDLYIDDWERRGRKYQRLLHQIRPAMAGGVLATCLCPDARPQIASVRAGVFAAEPRPKPLHQKPLHYETAPEDDTVVILERRLEEGDISLSEADVVIAGGAGCTAENWHLIEELAQRLEGRIAASRAAVEAGLAPRSAQVGQTGITVRPQLYVACGISGALQHVVGMQSARTIVAINRDREAPVFHFAHYGVVGDVADVLPRLTSAIAAQAG